MEIRNYWANIARSRWMMAICLMVVVWHLSTGRAVAQTYDELWRQVEEARQKDLPQTAVTYLQQIEKRALRNGDYGQLLSASLTTARMKALVAPDSLVPAVKRIEQQLAQSRDVAVQAVYATVLWTVYEDASDDMEEPEAHRKQYYAIATAHPETLAAIKAERFVPFVTTGKDSELYGHDLLSVVGSELGAWQWLSDYYTKTGNRPAACLTGLRQLADRDKGRLRAIGPRAYVDRLDSLIALYGDLPECGEVAIARYDFMDGNKDFSRDERVAWLQESLSRWGNWRRANRLRNDWTKITAGQYSVEAPEYVVMPDQRQTFRLTYRNLKQLSVRVYRTQLEGDTTLDPNKAEDYKKMKGGLTELTEMSHTCTFGNHKEWEAFSKSFQLEGLPVGIYLLEFSSQPETQVMRRLYYVTRLRVMMLPLPDENLRYVVVDALTGRPKADATVKLLFDAGWRKPMTVKTVKCDANGEAVYHCADDKHPAQVFAMTKDDKYCPKSSLYGRYAYYERDYESEHTSVYTDRSIYRPGQTVHVQAIVWKEKSELENVAVEGKQVTISLRDANYKQVAETTATTDRFGKCATEFTLPQGLLNGRFTVRVGMAAATIRVEEYKRPTFKVEFQEYDQPYQKGDTVQAQGKAVSFAGVPVQGATVKYEVVRRIAWWWLSYSRYWEQGAYGRGQDSETVYEGEATTADDGTFTVRMPMVLPYNLAGHAMYYHFDVRAEVTDTGGETHSGTMTLPLGTKATALTCNLPQQVRADQLPKVTFSRRNAAGKEIAGMVTYRLDNGKWHQAEANCQLSIVNGQLKSGEHRLEAFCEQDTIKMTFTIFSLDDKKPVISQGEWFYVSDRQFPADGSPVTIQVGAVSPELYMVYGLFAGSKEIERGRVERKNGEMLNLKIKYKEEYGNGLKAVFAWVKDGKTHVYETQIQRPLPPKKLQMTWETFRDRLTPGQQEEWRLKVMAPVTSGKTTKYVPADASLMAVLYDKSLDQLCSHQWNFSPSTYLSQPSTSWAYQQWYSLSASGFQQYQPLSYPSFQYSSFNHNLYPVYQVTPVIAYGMGRQRLAAPMAAETRSSDGGVVYDVVEAKAAVAVEESSNGVAEQQETPAADNGSGQETVQVRENMQETAFCYPALETDQDGCVVLKFTLPESLTTWRFMGVSNTVDMLYGYIDGEAVAQKDVMVQPNVPRFIRMGDDAQISARIFNTSDKAVSGTARLLLIDPATDQTVLEQSQAFDTEAGKTGTVTFRIASASSQWADYSLLICKVIASGEGFSDGEQHYLPILPDREQIIKTVPFTQHEPGVKTIDLTKLFPTGTSQQKLTVEYTNNPVWLLIQSLPVIGQPWENSSIDQAASYYSNMLAKTLLAQSPKVKGVFEQWRREMQEASSTAAANASLFTLHSSLEKKQELKDMLLSETPWVMDADRETEQRQRLADFFDQNGIDNRLSTALEKLKKLQRSDGSFSWYPEMPGSTAITVSIEEMLVRLTVMAGEQRGLKQIQDKAFNYIGKEMAEMVDEMKKREKKGEKPSFPSFTALRWLYICAIDGRQLSHRFKTANDYLINLMKKDIKRQSIYEKALSAIILAKHGETKKAAEYVQSLKEYTVYTEEMGRYYDTRRAYYSWYDYKIPTEVAAIEAIQTIAPQDRQTVDEMRRWLLQEKRTQAWTTPINSVNAIYAFLADHMETLDASQAQTRLAIDGQPLDLPKATAGMGYVKTVVNKPQGKEFTATKTSEGTSWGAVYGQFLQKTSEVEAAASGISVKRELMANGQRLDANSTLSVGDKLTVRITIESTRDLDFVQVVDRRAACMEPVRQLSGYRNGAYCTPKDNATHYYYYKVAKGKYVLETDYYLDRAGRYETGTCTVGCAYAPEYRATAPSTIIEVK